MKHHTTKAGLFAVCAALLLGSPAWADLREDVQDLQKSVKELREEVGSLQKRVVERDLEAAETNRRLLARLEDLNRELKRLNERSVVRSISGFGRDAVAATGTLRLRNTRQGVASVIIDGVSYTVEPGATRTLPDRIVGPFNYEVVVDGYTLPPRRTLLQGNETLTVTVY